MRVQLHSQSGLSFVLFGLPDKQYTQARTTLPALNRHHRTCIVNAPLLRSAVQSVAVNIGSSTTVNIIDIVGNTQLRYRSCWPLHNQRNAHGIKCPATIHASVCFFRVSETAPKWHRQWQTLESSRHPKLWVYVIRLRCYVHSHTDVDKQTRSLLNAFWSVCMFV